MTRKVTDRFGFQWRYNESDVSAFCSDAAAATRLACHAGSIQENPGSWASCCTGVFVMLRFRLQIPVWTPGLAEAKGGYVQSVLATHRDERQADALRGGVSVQPWLHRGQIFHSGSPEGAQRDPDFASRPRIWSHGSRTRRKSSRLLEYRGTRAFDESVQTAEPSEKCNPRTTQQQHNCAVFCLDFTLVSPAYGTECYWWKLLKCLWHPGGSGDWFHWLQIPRIADPL